MRLAAALLALFAALLSAPALAQMDVSGLVGNPAPASAPPPSEILAGAVGSDTGQYALANHQHPRITRATTAATISGGSFSGTWSSAFASPPTIILTPIASGSAAVTCELTAVPTTTAFAGRCWTSQSTLLNLTILGSGLTLNPNAASAAGISVQVIGIPPTQ